MGSGVVFIVYDCTIRKAGSYTENLNQGLFSGKQKREMGCLLHILSDKHNVYHIKYLNYYSLLFSH